MRPIYVFAALMVSFLMMPLVSLLAKTPIHAYSIGILSSPAMAAFRLSFLSSTVSAAIIFILGTPLAYCLAVKKSRLHRMVELVVELPAVLPPAVAGIALLMAFGRQGTMGAVLSAMNMNIPFTALAVIIAQIFVSAGYYIKAARSAFESIEPAIREESLSIGANEWVMLTTIYMPMVVKTLISGCMSAWSRAIGEFGATMIFAGNLVGKTRTMPLAIYTAMQSNMNTALGLSVIMLMVSAIVLLLSRQLTHSVS
ncbi:ABC transporter permease [Mahella sp.]|uniref:ABC transporter permease n=1 Tax=Mahella sp. TaxID=2798721 RepID=UPI0025C4150C|nr:ABC transporter permease [Mahella sp.]MBZ4666132.1 NifC-like protein ABC-type porter [Mahella sp.]